MVAMAIDEDSLGYRLGLVAFLMSAVFLIAAKTEMNADVLERIRQEGYDAGYDDGREAGLPPLVSLSGGRAASGQ